MDLTTEGLILWPGNTKFVILTVKMMKILTRIGSLVIVASALFFLANCGGDPAPQPAEQIQLGKLSKTWSIVSATLNGTTRTSEFANFKLTISGTFNTTTPEGPYNYSVSGSRPTPSPWDASGTWSFSSTGTGDTGSILRNDGVPMIYTINSNGQLTISDLICTSCNYQGARTDQVNGTWVFTFN